MSELPKSWVLATVHELADTSLGKMLDAKQQTGKHPTPYLRNINVRWGCFDLSDIAEMDVSPNELERVLAQPGDVIACEGGEPGRAAVWRGEPIAIQKALHRIRPTAGISSDYLAYGLRAAASTKQLDRLFTGTTIKHLPQEKLRQVQIALAPTAEQERIVAAIDEAFSKLNVGESALRTVRQLLKRMREAILTAAIAGRLVPQNPTDTPAAKLLADLGVEPHTTGVPTGWALTTLGSVFRIAVGTTPRRDDPSMWGGEVWWVSSGEVAFNRIRSTRETITSKAVLREGRVLPAGTVLLAMIGEGKTRGQPAILDVPAAHNQNCASIRVEGTEVSSEWVYTYLASRYSETRRAGSGNNQPALNKRLIEAIEIPIPPPEEQARIVAEVERQISFVEACERAVDIGLTRSAGLRRSVLKAAFEGRLAAQYPSDEPASELLDRIRAERSTQPVAKRRGRQTA